VLSLDEIEKKRKENAGDSTADNEDGDTLRNKGSSGDQDRA
jgi:hypothetical protein